MPQIEILDEQTIDEIAAGEVVERPASVVKELVENAIDAKASAITVEIKEGGIAMIRITDNGCGIDADQIPIAFYRHSTSKIRSVKDLMTISSLGFRGEALSSIAAVSQVELITKTQEQFTGCRYLIEGGKEVSLEEIGAPNGTTFLVKNLFYNTPVRRKFLKTAQTEAGYVNDLMERMALSHPDISFKFINNGQLRLHTSGNGQLKDIIYHIYGRDIAANLLSVNGEFDGFSVNGYIGKPLIARGNRNFESYFINGRYIRSKLIAKALEDAYHGFMMQHKYPFAVLDISLDGTLVDVNVHPNKMELRFSDGEVIYGRLTALLSARLRESELIPQTSVKDEPRAKAKAGIPAARIPEQFETKRLEKLRQAIAKDSPYEKKYDKNNLLQNRRMENTDSEAPSDTAVLQNSDVRTECSIPNTRAVLQTSDNGKIPCDDSKIPCNDSKIPCNDGKIPCNDATNSNSLPVQQTLYDLAEQKAATEKDDVLREELRLLSKESRPQHIIIGQLFDTYWLVEFNDQFYMIDQHAAHEKVLFEQTMRAYRTKEFTSQVISPPIILSLTMREEILLKKFLPEFKKIGFEIEPFGGKEYCISAVPDNLYGLDGQALLLELVDSLGNVSQTEAPEMVIEKVASMSCKAAVKGNQKLSRAEAEHLIDELLTLENPYFCPHGRPVIISMTRYEIEKKFKRIV